MKTHWRTGRLLAVVLLALGAGWPRAPHPPHATPPCPAPVELEIPGAAPHLLCDPTARTFVTRLCPPTAPIRTGDRLRPRLDPLRCTLDPTPLPAARRLRLGARLDVNTATVADLCRVPGIGPRTADAIVRGRPWRRVDDLLQIRGMGPLRLARVRAALTARPPLPPARPSSSLPGVSSPRRP